MAKKPKKEDALVEVLKVASSAVLTDLFLELATDRPDIRRESFDFLKMQSAGGKCWGRTKVDHRQLRHELKNKGLFRS